MLIQVHFNGINKSDTIDQFAHDQVQQHLTHMADRITRVEVYLKDENGSEKHAADDKSCTMEARPAGRQPLAVDHKGDNLTLFIAVTGGKVERALGRAFERSN